MIGHDKHADFLAKPHLKDAYLHARDFCVEYSFIVFGQLVFGIFGKSPCLLRLLVLLLQGRCVTVFIMHVTRTCCIQRAGGNGFAFRSYSVLLSSNEPVSVMLVCFLY